MEGYIARREERAASLAMEELLIYKLVREQSLQRRQLKASFAKSGWGQS